jgi:hypothetical protein
MGLNCKNLDFRSGVVKVSVFLGRGITSLGNWWWTFPDHHVTSKFQALVTQWCSATYLPWMNCNTKKLSTFCQDRLTFRLSHTQLKIPRKVSHSTHYYYYITFMQNVYHYTLGTNYVSTVYSVAAFLWLQYIVHVIFFALCTFRNYCCYYYYYHHHHHHHRRRRRRCCGKKLTEYRFYEYVSWISRIYKCNSKVSPCRHESNWTS